MQPLKKLCHHVAVIKIGQGQLDQFSVQKFCIRVVFGSSTQLIEGKESGGDCHGAVLSEVRGGAYSL